MSDAEPTTWPQYPDDLGMTQVEFMQTLKGRTIVEVVTGGVGKTVACFDLYLDDGRRVLIGSGVDGLPPLEIGLDDPTGEADGV
jgi:hypothetical protein